MQRRPPLVDRCARVHVSVAVLSRGVLCCRCISWGPDPEGVNGVFLGKDVPLQAGIMLEAVIKAITPKIMTWSQYAEAAYFMYQKKVMKNPAYKRYMPDYTKCMEHFALHAGTCV